MKKKLFFMNILVGVALMSCVTTNIVTQNESILTKDQIYETVVAFMNTQTNEEITQKVMLPKEVSDPENTNICGAYSVQAFGDIIFYQWYDKSGYVYDLFFSMDEKFIFNYIAIFKWLYMSEEIPVTWVYTPNGDIQKVPISTYQKIVCKQAFPDGTDEDDFCSPERMKEFESLGKKVGEI